MFEAPKAELIKLAMAVSTSTPEAEEEEEPMAGMGNCF